MLSATVSPAATARSARPGRLARSSASIAIATSPATHASQKKRVGVSIAKRPNAIGGMAASPFGPPVHDTSSLNSTTRIALKPSVAIAR